jgi:muramidase (phage lysozyme)
VARRAPAPARPDPRGEPGRLGRIADHRPVCHRFDPGPFPAERPADEPEKRRRFLQGSLLLGLVAATAALVVTVPNEDDPARSGSTTRIEAERPSASAELLASERSLGIEGSLADAGALAAGAEAFFQQPDPAGPLAIAYRHLSGVVEPVTGTTTEDAASAGPTTTAWVEPTLPPPSAWVDTGNGVEVPDLLLRIRYCESTNDYQAVNPSSSARGAYQFLTSSWAYYGFAEQFGAAEAHLATPAQQDQAALEVLQAEGTAPWAASRSCWADPDLRAGYATVEPAPKRATAAAPTTTTAPAGSSTTDSSVDGSSSTSTGGSTTTTGGSSTTSTTDPGSSTTAGSTTSTST